MYLVFTPLRSGKMYGTLLGGRFKDKSTCIIITKYLYCKEVQYIQQDLPNPL